MTNCTPLNDLSPLFVFRFWTHVEQDGECLVWRAALNRDGYGIVKLGKRYVRAHRVAYTLALGAIPDGLVIDHLCRNRACVNAEHLEAVTSQENTLRGLAANGGPGRRPATVCKFGHDFTEENSLKVRGGKRCKTCHRDYHREYKRKTRAAIKAAQKLAQPLTN